MEWLEAVSDSGTRWRWLVRLRAVALDARYAEDECDVGPYHWRRGLEMSSPPTVSANPYEGRGSMSPFAISLAPELHDPSADPAGQRLEGLNVIMGYGVGEIQVDVWRCPDGVAFDPAAVLVTGTADKPTMDASGVITLQCVGFLDQYDREFPVATCEPRLHPGARASDQGAGYPLLLGEYDSSDCPCIDESLSRHLVCSHFRGHVHRLTPGPTIYEDGAASASAWLGADVTDADGNEYRLIDCYVGTAGKVITISGDGLIDDAIGTYTGTPSATIHHPADQIRFMAQVACNIPAARVNTLSFAQARTLMPGWKFASTIKSTDTKSFVEFVEEICKWLCAAVVPERGRIALRVFSPSAPPVMTLDEQSILEGESIEWGDKTLVATRYLLYYKFGLHVESQEWRYLSSLSYGPTESAALRLAETKLGVRYAPRAETRADNLRDDATAAAVVANYARLREKVRRVVKVRCSAKTHALNMLDNVMVDLSSVPWWSALGTGKMKMAVTEISYGLHDNLLTLMEC